MKYLTISVAAYNAEKWIERCLDSFCVPEVIEEIEVLIVNDGSTDQTEEVAQKYVECYPNTFRLFNKENGGHGSTINVGIKNARGKYFKIVDADDWVEKDGLINLVNILKHVDEDVVLSPYYEVDANTLRKTIKYSFNKSSQMKDNIILNIDDLATEFELHMHSITYKTILLQENFTPIDEHCFYVDMEYLVFYFHLVKNIYISDIPVYDYLIGTNEQSVNMVNMVKRRDQHLKVCKRIIEYYYSPNNNKLIQSIIEGMIIVEYRILLAISDLKESKTELLSFDNYLKNKGNLYTNAISSGIISKKETAMFVRAMRKVKYKGYALLHFFCKKSKVKLRKNLRQIENKQIEDTKTAF